MRARTSEGLKPFISKLYERPALKFLRSGEEWEPLADLIYGPYDLHTDSFFNEDVRQKSFARLDALRELWQELRDDIEAARRRYAPDRRPWGCRFDEDRR